MKVVMRVRVCVGYWKVRWYGFDGQSVRRGLQVLWHTSWAGLAGWLAGVTRGRAHLASVTKVPHHLQPGLQAHRENVSYVSSALGTSLDMRRSSVKALE